LLPPRFSRIARGLGRLACAVALIAGPATLTGCISYEEDGPLGYSLGDPSELGRYPRQPLVVQTLRTLPGTAELEGPNTMFASAVDVTDADLKYTAADYPIGPGDLLQISISDLVAPGVERVVSQRVSETGNISLPLAGQIAAGGKTEAQLEVAINQQYRDLQLMNNAPISVTVVEALSRTFSVAGAVNAPGLYAINKPNFRLLDAYVLARSATSEVGIPYIYVIRTLPSDNAAPAAPARPAGPGVRPGANDPLAPTPAPGSALPTPAQPNAAAPVNGPVYFAAQAQPATAPGDTEGRILQVEGQQRPASAAPTAAAPVADPLAAVPPTSAPAAAPAVVTGTKAPFEFNAPAEPNNVRVIRIPFENLKKGELKYNIIIKPGDVVYVPSPAIGEYYLGGHILRTGVYSLTARDVTLTQAIISAGGLDQVAIPQRTLIRRKIDGDREVIVRVDLAKIFAGFEPNIYLKPDDQVMVGTNALAPFIAVLRNSFRFTYGFGFLYDKNFAEEGNQN
jgi:protein involved in polysaccharide export with SLBB domain